MSMQGSSMADGKRALVHIGAPKTGTTSIQRTFARAQREGALKGVTYPLLRGVEGKVRAKHPFYFAHRPLSKFPPGMKRIYDGHEGMERLECDLTAFREDLSSAAASAQGMILSSEDLMTFPESAIINFRDCLADLGYTQITPVIYVRDPVARYLSSVQQIIKASGKFTPPADHKDWTLTFIRRWRRHFPGLIVRPFDRRMLHGGDAVADFLEVAIRVFGHEVVEGQIRAVHSNESISAEGMIILQQYRAKFQEEHEGVYRPASDRLIRLLQRSLVEMSIDQTKAQLNASSTAALVANHGDFLDELQGAYGFDLSKYQHMRNVQQGAQCETESPVSVAGILKSYDPVVLDEVMLWVLHQVLSRSRRLP